MISALLLNLFAVHKLLPCLCLTLLIVVVKAKWWLEQISAEIKTTRVICQREQAPLVARFNIRGISVYSLAACMSIQRWHKENQMLKLRRLSRLRLFMAPNIVCLEMTLVYAISWFVEIRQLFKILSNSELPLQRSCCRSGLFVRLL